MPIKSTITRERFLTENNVDRAWSGKSPHVVQKFCFHMLNSAHEFDSFFDHIEVFKTKTGGYIVTTSPYGHARRVAYADTDAQRANLDEFKAILGFVETHQIYNDWCTTFMRDIPDLTEFRQEMKRWSGKRNDAFSFRRARQVDTRRQDYLDSLDPLPMKDGEDIMDYTMRSMNDPRIFN
jgi:hypothetical protein